MYNKYIKRILDFLCSFIAILVILPIFLVLIILGSIIMKGNPFFVQERPGKNNKVFHMIKFRTMTCEKDEKGQLLPDDQRLTKYGSFLRKTSIDELPELFNVFLGQMSFVGPRPLLIKDLAFMDENVKNRHSIRGGITGLAQINGRNNITWDRKFQYDLEYVEKVSLFLDIKILILTFFKVIKRKDVNREGTVSDIDYGDWLLKEEKITQEEYRQKMEAIKNE